MENIYWVSNVLNKLRFLKDLPKIKWGESITISTADYRTWLIVDKY